MNYIDRTMPCIYFVLLKLLLYVVFIRKHPVAMDHVENSIKKRKYSEDLLLYGFTSIITAEIEKLLCVICCEVQMCEAEQTEMPF